MTTKIKIDIEDIVIEYLEKNGFDGLCNNYDHCADGCGCKKEEMHLCDHFSWLCEPAYVVKTDACRLCTEYKFCMSYEKDTHECPYEDLL